MNPTDKTARRYLRTAEMAARLGVTESFLSKDRQSTNPTVPFVKIGRRAYLYDADMVDAMIASRMAASLVNASGPAQLDQVQRT